MWEWLLDRMLRRLVRKGALRVTLPSGKVRHYGDGQGEEIAVRITSPRTVRRLVLNPDLSLGESYMDGTLQPENDDIAGLLALALENRNSQGPLWWMRLIQWARWLIRPLAQFNPARRARNNVAHHYDLSGALYDLFLDADRQYSCAYFRHPDDTLEQAQDNKKHHIARKLLIEPDMKVLDIGCGWGGMALTLARDYGARVVGVTLSEEQHALARKRVRDAGLEDRIDIRLMDYRELNERFDRIVSVGMFEHVGVPHYREYFCKVRELLTEDGVALIHTIGRTDGPGTTNPFILKYIFPGGYVPALSEAAAAFEKERLYPDDVEIWRLHYAETLRHWREHFEANIDKARALYDDRFCRMWRFYLAASEMTFRHDDQAVFQFQLSRRQEAVPLTRDYLYRDEGEQAGAERPQRLHHAAE